MSFLDAVILGILQGLTEFLPVSSSGHLVLAQVILNVKQAGVSFEILVHLGSLLAVLVYFRSKIILLIKSVFDKSMVQERKMVLFLIIGTIPTVIAALLFNGFFKQAFSDPVMTSVMLVITGLILVSTRFVSTRKNSLKLPAVIAIGLGQTLAILPGISRSGTTISVGMMAGVDPSEAAEFSFILAIPAILGALIFNVGDIVSIDSSVVPQYITGAIVTFGASLFAVYAVLAAIRRGKFVYFGYYCFAAGGFGLYLFL